VDAVEEVLTATIQLKEPVIDVGTVSEDIEKVYVQDPLPVVSETEDTDSGLSAGSRKSSAFPSSRYKASPEEDMLEETVSISEIVNDVDLLFIVSMTVVSVSEPVEEVAPNPKTGSAVEFSWVSWPESVSILAAPVVTAAPP
jgi:hypothetical protein